MKARTETGAARLLWAAVAIGAVALPFTDQGREVADGFGRGVAEACAEDAGPGSICGDRSDPTSVVAGAIAEAAHG